MHSLVFISGTMYAEMLRIKTEKQNLSEIKLRTSRGKWNVSSECKNRFMWNHFWFQTRIITKNYFYTNKKKHAQNHNEAKLKRMRCTKFHFICKLIFNAFFSLQFQFLNAKFIGQILQFVCLNENFDSKQVVIGFSTKWKIWMYQIQNFQNRISAVPFLGETIFLTTKLGNCALLGNLHYCGLYNESIAQ